MKRAILIFLFTLICFNANADKFINDWSGLYLGAYQSNDKLTESATSTSWPDNPYSVTTDKNMYNTGSFVGYNYSINNIIVGLSVSETNLDLYYPDTKYLEGVQLKATRLRFGYLF